MKVRFLLGPAGVGKTCRCVNDAKASLAQSAWGAPLVFIAPKQATFQIERQILSDPAIKGFTRLHILSFERLARFVLDRLRVPVPELLSEQGRVMVLRALLTKHADELEIFQKSARRIGFSEELSQQLREFQQYQLSPAGLRRLAAREDTPDKLRGKLRDLAFIAERYEAWLEEHRLRDGDSLLSIAAEHLRSLWQRMGEAPIPIDALWLDGFSQMTPQERELLLALVACAKTTTLAFCMDQCPSAPPWQSPWAVVYQTFDQCRTGIRTRFPETEIEVEQIQRHGLGRFASSPVLAHLEANWAKPVPAKGIDSSSVRIATCTNFEAETVYCAREILRFVRNGGRYREIAVLLRDFDTTSESIPRVFARYGIPFFIDRRESISHHPLAELTRGTLRSIVLGWRIPDLFSSLKSGLWPISASEIDHLENEALANGWEGELWKKPFAARFERCEIKKEVEELRQQIVAHINSFAKRLGEEPSGRQLADAIRNFWGDLKVAEKLQEWSETNDGQLDVSVLSQMEELLENIERAFGEHQLRLKQWLPILESGLATLTVGLIPPALDQVLVGSVARSRNPDLKVAFVLGLNEGIFPAVPLERKLLTETDREHLLKLGLSLSPVASFQLSQEQFYGYIACTRAREQLVLTHSELSAAGKPINKSRFLKTIKDLCGDSVFVRPEWNLLADAQHISEILPAYFQFSENQQLRELLSADISFRSLPIPAEPDKSERLRPEVTKELFNGRLYTSITALERFAACPFQYFMRSVLSADERLRFELDFKEEGSFKHEVLETYHKELAKVQKRWRDVTQEEARELIGRICDQLSGTFQGGLLTANKEYAFRVQGYKSSLQDFIAIITRAFDSSKFDPAAAEAAFQPDSEFKTWKIELTDHRILELNGKIDRIDLFHLEDRTLFLLIDYKSSETKINQIEIHHGLRQQLTGYLLTLSNLKDAHKHLNAKRLEPAGFFYASLKMAKPRSSKRSEVLGKEKEAVTFNHFGLFNLNHKDLFDEPRTTMYKYRLTNKNNPVKGSFAALPNERFQQILDRSRDQLIHFATRILDGDISVSPAKMGKKLVCQKCNYSVVCRYDPWIDQPRPLVLPEEDA